MSYKKKKKNLKNLLGNSEFRFEDKFVYDREKKN